MKTQNIIIALTCMLACIACNNEPEPLLEYYRPMVVEGYQWNTIMGIFYGSEDDGYLTSIWKIQGDSTIDNKVYKKLWLSHKEDQSDANIIELLREDISEQKIYMYRNGKDVLLYDFGMKIGEKTKLYISEYYYERTDKEYYLELFAINKRRDQTTTIYREFRYNIYCRYVDKKDSEYERIGTHVACERFGTLGNGIMPDNWAGLLGNMPRDVLCVYDENGTVVLSSDASDTEYAGYCFYTTTDGFH